MVESFAFNNQPGFVQIQIKVTKSAVIRPYSIICLLLIKDGVSSKRNIENYFKVLFAYIKLFSNNLLIVLLYWY